MGFPPKHARSIDVPATSRHKYEARWNRAEIGGLEETIFFMSTAPNEDGAGEMSSSRLTGRATGLSVLNGCLSTSIQAFNILAILRKGRPLASHVQSSKAETAAPTTVEQQRCTHRNLYAGLKNESILGPSRPPFPLFPPFPLLPSLLRFDRPPGSDILAAISRATSPSRE